MKWPFGKGDVVEHEDGTSGKVVGHKADGFVDVRMPVTGIVKSFWGGNLTREESNENERPEKRR